MKKAIIAVLLVTIGYGTLLYLAHEDSKTFKIRNNNTRDYKYEHYCDSIYEVDVDYYYDVLVETDKFQNYIEEHGEWWTN